VDALHPTTGAKATLDVLREIWTAQGQTAERLTDGDCTAVPSTTGKSCKRMTDVGFEALAEEYDGDMRAAWRATLKREGKLRPGAGLRDLLDEQSG
jgi:hypothetical protein